MNIDWVIMSADRDQCFADWGVPVVFREVAQTYEPEAGALAESYVDHVMTAIVGAAGTETQAGTAGQHALRERRFLIQLEDLPSGVEPRSGRIVYAGIEYQIESSTVSAAGGILRCTAGGVEHDMTSSRDRQGAVVSAIIAAS